MSAQAVVRGAAFAAAAWIGLTCVALAQAPTAAPLAFLTLTGRVVDDAGLLPADDRATLSASLAGLEARTTDQLVVVTVKSLQGTAIEDYGYQLGRRWGIGQKDKDSGVLLIVAAAERRVRIEVGYGLEGTLTDASTRLIIENRILPAFKAGDFPRGIKAGVSGIIQVLGGEADTTPRGAARGMAGTPPQAGTPVWVGVALGLGGVGLLIFCAVRGGAACRGIMQLLLLLALSGRGGSSRGRSSSFSGGGGSFGGGGSSGSW